MKRLFLLLCLAIPLAAQTFPANHYDVVGICTAQAPNPCFVSGGWAHLVSDPSSQHPTYSYSAADVTWGAFTDHSVSGVIRNLTQPKVTTTSGLAQHLTEVAGWQVFGLGALGVVTTPGGSETGATGFAANTGFFAVHALGKSNWTLDLHARAIAGTGSPQYLFGIGFGFGK